VDNVNSVNPERRVTIAARVPPDLAEAVATLAERGDRTVSREVFRAIRTHVQESAVGSGSSVDSGSGSAVGRGSSVDDPAERDGTSTKREAVEPAQLAGLAQREENEQ
jgi:predicted transcriptional regulator